jgi:hypothetical protein
MSKNLLHSDEVCKPKKLFLTVSTPCPQFHSGDIFSLDDFTGMNMLVVITEAVGPA